MKNMPISDIIFALDDCFLGARNAMERFWFGAANARRLNVLKVKNQVYVLRVRRERYKKVYFLFWRSFFLLFGAKKKVNQELAKGREIWRA